MLALVEGSRMAQKQCSVAQMTRGTLLACSVLEKPGSNAVALLASRSCLMTSSAELLTVSLSKGSIKLVRLDNR